MIFNFIFSVLASLIGVLLSPQININFEFNENRSETIVVLMIMVASLTISSFINGCDAKMFLRSKADYIVNVLVAAIFGVLFANTLTYFLKFKIYGRWLVGIIVVAYVLFNTMHVAVFRRWLSSRVLVFDLAGGVVKNILGDLGYGETLPRFIWGVNDCGIGGIRDGVKNAGDRMSTFIVVDPHDDKVCEKISSERFDFDLNNIVTADIFFENEFTVVPIDFCRERFWWQMKTRVREGSYQKAKRVFDFIALFVLSFVLVPIMLIGCLLVWLQDFGPVFYRQTRLGQYGRPFAIIKLRTMISDSEKGGAQWAKVGDTRVTAVGKILRKTRIDEIPQLWNILVGDMSFIGPRPERPEFYSYITGTFPSFNLRLVCKPGLTGWAQVNYPYGASLKDSKVKLMYDLYYIKNATFLLEIRILMRTVVAMVRGAR
jgi:lipopolysaccharide/colanic/teichoic acid biosynthesis glycosyltransferase